MSENKLKWEFTGCEYVHPVMGNDGYLYDGNYRISIADLKQNVQYEISDEVFSKKLHQAVCRSINDEANLSYDERKFYSMKVLPYLEKLEAHYSNFAGALPVVEVTDKTNIFDAAYEAVKFCGRDNTVVMKFDGFYFLLDRNTTRQDISDAYNKSLAKRAQDKELMTLSKLYED